MTVDCQRCYQPVTGPGIHDQGTTWHPECRQAFIAERAERNAIRFTTPRKLELAQVLVIIQRQSIAAMKAA